MILAFDNAILQWIQSNLRCLPLDWIMPRITALGNGGWLWIVVTAAFLIPKKTRPIGLGMLTALVLATYLGDYIIKPLVGRIRPFEANGFCDLLILPPWGYSFPSGHTMTSFGVAYTLWKNDHKLGWPAFITAALIAFSRLYLYVHYPTDVLAGLLLGFLCGWIGFWVQRRLACEC